MAASESSIGIEVCWTESVCQNSVLGSCASYTAVTPFHISGGNSGSPYQ